MVFTVATGFAQNPIYSNQSGDRRVPALNASPITEHGTVAPAGDFWSELQHDAGNTTGSNNILGQSAYFVGTAGSDQFRLADDFYPNCTNWIVTGVKYYCYATNQSAPVAVAGNVKFWNSPPVTSGVPIASFDSEASSATHSITDVFRVTSSETGRVFRIVNTVQPTVVTTPSTNRKVWENTLSFGSPLTCEVNTQFWLDFQSIKTAEFASNFFPLVTIVGTRSVPNANSLQLVESSYVAVIDRGSPASEPDYAVDVPFILLGRYQCAADTASLLIGDQETGGVRELKLSDDFYYEMFPDTVNSTLVAQCVLSTSTPVTRATQVDLVLELKVGRQGLSYQVEVYDGSTNRFVSVGGGLAPIADTVFTFSALGAAATRWTQDGVAKARLTFQPVNDEDPSQNGWPHDIDQAYWEINPSP